VRGDFREDLYYRLNVVTISIPPLRERRDDIPLLFSHFAARAAERFRRDVSPLSPDVRRHLASHTWPGNVRELSHYAERVVLGVEGGRTATISPQPTGVTLPERLERYEAEIIRDALSANDGDVRRTIEALGIPRKTFYDKLQRHGITRGGYTARK
jgi:two-component system C4-dicarboxylate transport response regulator DctD